MFSDYLKKFFWKIREKSNSTAGVTLVSLGIGMALTLFVFCPTIQWFLSLSTNLHNNQSIMDMETLALGEYNIISDQSYIEAYNRQGDVETKENSDGKYRIKIIYGNEEVIEGTDEMPLNSIPIEIRVEDISDSSKNFVLNHKVISNTENSELVHNVAKLLDKANHLVVPCHQNETRNSSGVCVCNNGYEKFNKRCVLKCKANEVRNSSGTCVCVSGYEKVSGVCKPKCTANQHRDSSGKCVCNEGYGLKNGVCTELTESEKHGCKDNDVENPPLIRTTIRVDDNYHAYLSKSPTVRGIEWDYHQDWNHGMYSSMKAMQLEEHADAYYLQVQGWNDNGGEILKNADVYIVAATNKPYYVFDNGKNYIDTITDWQYFMISRAGFGQTVPISQIAHSSNSIWTKDSAYGTVYVTLRLRHIKKGEKCSY